MKIGSIPILASSIISDLHASLKIFATPLSTFRLQGHFDCASRYPPLHQTDHGDASGRCGKCPTARSPRVVPRQLSTAIPAIEPAHAPGRVRGRLQRAWLLIAAVSLSGMVMQTSTATGVVRL